MSTGTPIPDEIRAAAIADLQNSGDSLRVVAKRNGVSRAALAAWISPRPATRPRNRKWAEDEIAYYGGWEVRRGIRYPLAPEQRSA